MVRTDRRHSARVFGLLRLVLALMLTSYALPVHAQRAASDFEVDVVCARPKGSAQGTRVDVYTRIPNRNLQFIRSGNAFKAGYTVTASFYEADERGRKGRLVKSDSWKDGVTAGSYAATQAADQHDRALGSLDLPPGLYMAVIRIEDEQTRRSYTREVPANVRDMHQPISVSDLVLIEGYDARQNAITPIVGAAVGTNQDAFKLFYEIYAAQPERVRIIREVVRVDKKNAARSLRNIFNLNEGEDLGEITYTRAEPTALKAGRFPFVVDIPVGELQAGEYRLRVRVENEQGLMLAYAEKAVTAEWTGLEDHIRNVDQAVDQLKYIAKDKELAQIRAGRTPSERTARLEAFWKRRDPTPGTERNERMEEYYYRITYAERRYGNIAAGGWQSDRGQVLVLFGEPDRIDRHGQRVADKPYEVWHYNRIGKKFIFVDQTGRGDYRLETPIWDDRNKLR